MNDYSSSLTPVKLISPMSGEEDFTGTGTTPQSLLCFIVKGMLRVLEDDQLFPVSRCHRLVEPLLNRFSDPGSRCVDYLLNGFFRKQLHRFCTGLLLHQQFQETLRPCHGRLRLSGFFFIPKI